MQKSESYKKLVWLLLMTVYICALLYITLFSRSRTIIRLVSFNPFRAFVLWLEGNAAKGKAILQNVALFVPFGYILFAFQRRKKNSLWLCYTSGIVYFHSHRSNSVLYRTRNIRCRGYTEQYNWNRDWLCFALDNRLG